MIHILLFLLPALAMAQFTNESELSLIQSGGNAEAQTSNVRTTNLLKWEKHSAGFGGHYTYGENSDNVSVRNWDVNAKLEKEVEPKLSLILGEVIEGNRFIGIKARYNSDAGFRYYYDKTDALNFFSELGYRYTVEDRYEPLENAYDNRGRLYNEFDHKFSETVQYKFWLEYVHNFSFESDYLINGEASVTSILNSVFSLKVAYKGMYDNRPATSGFKNYDFLTTTSLVAKF